MEDGLERLKETGKTDRDRQRLLDLLLGALRGRGHFAAVEAQAGPAFGDKDMRWHKDGATGLLHLGITLGGRRRLEFHASGHRAVSSWTSWAGPVHAPLVPVW
ncbi:unnamed protein product [Prorocentrum cordatum]|uniref:Uncharacterized protein n=1 Tax=Prorocentrum cordatum TaxID=2364126 RepID=A0ABN9SKG4_9DINO|nr:unnamed protein product [Polarella glacialis]